MNSYGLNDYSKYQHNPEQVKQSLAYITSKASEVKTMIEELLYLLDLQENAPWLDMLEKYSAIAANMSQLQASFRKSGISGIQEDNGKVMRSNVIVPQLLTMEVNPELQKLTEGRVHSWNHEVVPVSLRTKPDPSIEREEMILDNERQNKASDNIIKQVSAMNKHAESLMMQLQTLERTSEDSADFKPTYSDEDTICLVKAIMTGEGIRVAPKPQQPSQGQQQPGVAPISSMQPGPLQGLSGPSMRR
ncbi:unnamed protein product, partial [Mesorhabditis belari]|uniref:Mediator of RNA polymerase II transcription subunit 8 n=1 Tax=Mesorhabditis belari TaxID=2138241 RepID=A0AAF3JAA5_9BILA